MYKTPEFRRGTLEHNLGQPGETLEQKLDRIVNNKEPIKDGAPLIYTERAKGVIPSYNIKTDRFEIAIEAMDKVAKSYKARREERAAAGKSAETKGAESIQGKDGTTGEKPKN